MAIHIRLQLDRIKISKKMIKRRLCFTLIELLVVIAIILLTIVFGVPAFNKYGNNAEVSSTAEQIQATIEKAYANSTTPPQNANEIHLWLMYGGNSGKVVNARAYKQTVGVTSDATTNPGNADTSVNTNFPAEIVTIPEYMHLEYETGVPGDQLFCNFIVAGSVNCYNYTSTTPSTPLGGNIDLILSSDKTDLEYRISLLKNPFRVRTSVKN